MDSQTIIQIVNGYQTQLINAEVANDTIKINWLKNQINEGNKMLAQCGTRNVTN
jgi:hypothetical protein